MTLSKAFNTLQAQCNTCDKVVTAYPLLNKADLVSALKRGLDVRVMHVTLGGDHIWSVTAEDKQSLRDSMS